MIAPLVAFGAWLIIAGSSLVVWQAKRSAEAIPMHWGLDGTPTWYAPPAVALAFLPIISGAILALMYVKSDSIKDRDGRIMVSSVVFLCIHLFFLWKIR